MATDPRLVRISGEAHAALSREAARRCVRMSDLATEILLAALEPAGGTTS